MLSKNPFTAEVVAAALALACTMALSGEAKAASYFTNFDPLPGQSTLSGQDGWDTNNYSEGATASAGDDLGQSDFVGTIPGYSATTSDNWVMLGGAMGVAPVVDTSYLYKPLGFAGDSSAFGVKFGIASSQAPRTQLDTFGWVFRDANGGTLLRISFIPDTNQAGNLTLKIYDVTAAEVPGSGTTNIFYNSRYNLGVTMTGSNVSVTLTDMKGNPPVTVVNNQTLAGATSGAISDIAASWTVVNTAANAQGERTNYGSNALLFDNYSYSAVPEPSSLALCFIGLGFLVRRNRRN